MVEIISPFPCADAFAKGRMSASYIAAFDQADPGNIYAGRSAKRIILDFLFSPCQCAQNEYQAHGARLH
jgi:hypothetical protein